MPHITLPDALPGIRGPMAFRPETAGPINALADVLLRGPSTLTPGERELIATCVSAENECRYCQTIHGAIAAHHLGDEALVLQVKADAEAAPVSEKLKALLAIDLEIHDTVLIAAFFCLCNRYVDGLATWAPDDPDFYRQRAALVAEHGYAGATPLAPGSGTSQT